MSGLSPLDVLREYVEEFTSEDGTYEGGVFNDAWSALAQVEKLVEAAKELSAWTGIEPGAENYSIERGYVHDLRSALAPFVGQPGDDAT